MSDESHAKPDQFTFEVVEAASPGDTIFIRTQGLSGASQDHRNAIMDGLKELAERYRVQVCVFDDDVLEVMTEKRMAELGWVRREAAQT